MKEIGIRELDVNMYSMIADNWPLLTSGNKENGYNTMTISWGHIGGIWGHNMPTVIAYVRPQRYTKQFMDKNEYFTLSILDEKYKKELAYLGSHSGKDEDKIANAGLHVEFFENTTYIKESDIVLVCRKVYQDSLKEECFKDYDVMNNAYPKRDFHDFYVGEIVKILIKD